MRLNERVDVRQDHLNALINQKELHKVVEGDDCTAPAQLAKSLHRHWPDKAGLGLWDLP